MSTADPFKLPQDPAESKLLVALRYLALTVDYRPRPSTFDFSISQQPGRTRLHRARFQRVVSSVDIIKSIIVSIVSQDSYQVNPCQSDIGKRGEQAEGR